MVDITPLNGDEWTQEVKNALQKYVANSDVLRMTIVDETTDPFKVMLFEQYPALNICINAALVRDNLAASTGTAYVFLP